MPDDDAEFATILREGGFEGTVMLAELLAERYDGLLLTGGGDVAGHFFSQEHHPAANPPDVRLDAAELALTRAFIRENKPVLGICRGMQVLNIAMGGDLIQNIPALLGLPREVHMGNSHYVDIMPDSWLYNLLGSRRVSTNSFHHQALGRVAAGFSVVGITGPVIESIERGNALGVQFHPELMLDQGMLPVFEDFIKRSSSNNVRVDTFSTRTIIEVQDGQYLDVMNAIIVAIDNTSGITRAMFETYWHYEEGMYLVGYHLPAGGYKLVAVEDAPLSFYTMFDTSLTEAAIANIAVNEYSLVDLEEGQYIRLTGAKMIPV